jgi:hypothetical protein
MPCREPANSLWQPDAHERARSIVGQAFLPVPRLIRKATHPWTRGLFGFSSDGKDRHERLSYAIANTILPKLSFDSIRV